ncbi:MAG: transglycosylase SLT domain-containing protein [Xanthobacteraceae bacterium]|nr:transglycosylase SLT domain-containing protein [Xanthobacteraceae bacterium]
MDTTSIVAGFESATTQITGSIKQAAEATGASFEYLLSAAKMESNFNPSAAASTSSAHGLYQFIDQTWLATVKEAGPSLGFGQYADAITKSASGTYSVADPAMRSEILKLRDDPAVSAAMAGVLTQSNGFKLTAEIGRRPTDAELYMAHFMGVGGAAKLITSAAETPQVDAARMFPSAAAANPSIFYDRGGNSRSVSEVYSLISTRYQSAVNSRATQSALTTFGSGDFATAQPAAATGSTTAVSATTAAAPPTSANAAFLSGFPQATAFAAANAASAASTADTPSAAPAQAASAPLVLPSAPAQDSAPPATPTFRSLYQAGDRTEPLSSAVRALWGNGSGDNAQGQGRVAAQPLDLFSDRSGIFSGGG